MDIQEILNLLPEIVQSTYFSLNPYNPNNTEDNYQELLRENLNIKFNRRIDSEVTYQKSSKDILGDEICLKNKTERIDLLMKSFSIIFELKNVEKLDKSHENQLLNYMNNTEYEYGILINFAKSKNLKNCVAHYKIYKKNKKITKEDKFGNHYSMFTFEFKDEFISENYNDLMGEYIQVDNVIQIT